MDKVPADQQGGAHKSHKTGNLPEKYTDAVGNNSGESFPGGSSDAPGSDRGFHVARDANPLNPQNTHEVVQPEYKRIPHVGPVTFPTEP